MDIINTVYAQGTGTPLVLLHAFPIDHRMWEETAELVGQGASEQGMEPVTIYAPDMPGAGACPIPDAQSTGEQAEDGAYTQALDRLADAYVDMLHAKGHDRAIWVGLSMGGYVALAVQRLHPDSVAGIALCDTKAGADSDKARRHRIDVASRCERDDDVEAVMNFAHPQPNDSTIKKSPQFVKNFENWIREQTPEGIAWRERMAAGREDQSDQLGLISTPALVLSGDLDPSSPPEVMRPLAAAIVNADVEFVEIPDSGHFSAVEHPQEVSQALLALVRKVRSAQ